MHQVIHTIRRIATADLPKARDLETGGDERPMTPSEMLNVGIQHVADDLYSCVEQQRRDPATLEWKHDGPELPGQTLSAGDVEARYRALPAADRRKVLRARVIRSDGAKSAAELASENVLEQAAMIEEHVGEIETTEGTRPLVDFDADDPVVEEALRLSRIPGSGIELHTVTMADVDGPGDVVEATNLIPHSWAGERLPPGGRIR